MPLAGIWVKRLTYYRRCSYKFENPSSRARFLS